MARSLPPHGTVGRRNNYGCDCFPCRVAAAKYYRDRRHRIKSGAQKVVKKTPPEHGTMSCYSNHGCRCRPCKDATAAYSRARRARAKRERFFAEAREAFLDDPSYLESIMRNAWKLKDREIRKSLPVQNSYLPQGDE